MPDPITQEIPTEVYRVGRRGHLVDYSKITPEDAVLPTAGNRFDVPGGAVLYVGTKRIACYAETLCRYRVTPKIRDLVKDETGFMVAGGVPQDWRLQRQMGTLTIHDPLPFLDVEAPETQAFLSEQLAGEMMLYGYEDNLDISVICNQDRRISRAIAMYAYTASDETGVIYGGIRYVSRVHPEWECWAVFDGTPVSVLEEQSIELNDPDLEKIADMWGLRLF